MTATPKSAAPEAAQFARLLRSWMERRGVTTVALAARSGLNVATVVFYRNARSVPNQEAASRLADALDAPEVLAAVTRWRQRECLDCGRTFMATRLRAIRPIRHCSEACANRDRQRAKLGTSRNRLLLAERERDELRARVAAFCADCESDGVCRDAMAVAGRSCVFRDVTPFVLVENVRIGHRRVA